MDFASFLILLVISAIVAAVLHYGLKFYVVPGLGSYLGKVALGWIGARLGRDHARTSAPAGTHRRGLFIKRSCGTGR